MHRLVLQLTFCVFLIEDFPKSLRTYLFYIFYVKMFHFGKVLTVIQKIQHVILKKSSLINMLLLNLTEVGQKFDFL